MRGGSLPSDRDDDETVYDAGGEPSRADFQHDVPSQKADTDDNVASPYGRGGMGTDRSFSNVEVR